MKDLYIDSRNPEEVIVALIDNDAVVLENYSYERSDAHLLSKNLSEFVFKYISEGLLVNYRRFAMRC
jgi:hypothetical protein